MRYTITNEIAGRIRLRCDLGFIDDGEARGVAYDLMRSGLVRHAEVHPANQSLLVRFDPARREEVLAFIAAFDPLRLPREDEAGLEDFCNAIEMASENNRFQMQLAFVFMRRWLFRLLPLPLAMQRIWVLLRAIPFLRAGWQRLIHRELKVELLDAAAISASIMNGNWGEAGQIMFLLNLSGVMEDHVASRARLALRNGLITRADNVWAVIDGQDVRIPIASVTKGQILHLNAGSVLPVDGSVVEGEGELNEASMTGESRLVHKREGSTVYAGTALEDGDLKIRVTAPPGVSRIDGIVEMVEQSAQLKAGAQSKAERLSDALVPYNFAAFFALLAITRNVQKAMTVLMVDYSCAIKLSTPVAVGSAMDEAANFGMTVKGGKYLEKFAAADLIVFDKTGTLTIPNQEIDFTKADNLPLEARETLKPHAAEAMQELQNAGIEVHMMSGDKEEAARYWAEKAGIKHYRSKVLPQDKENLVRELQQRGKTVAMVGDGINDTQALALADVSIAIGRGTDVAMDVAQVTLMGDDLRSVPKAIQLSRRTVKMIAENLFWAFIYNIVCLPLAAGVLYLFGISFQITPMWASALMAFSSVSVVLNSLRLKLMA